MAAETLIKEENLDIPVMVSILLVEDDEIQRLNCEFMGKDSVTDVLSFPMIKMKDGKFLNEPGCIDMDDGRFFLGDIVISVPRAIGQAELYGHSTDRELVFLTVHGLLHLLGYDHVRPADEEIMIERQKQAMSCLGLGKDA